MNVIFISPNFPQRNYNFCERMKAVGINVLGIGDDAFDSMSKACQDSMTEYYYVKDMNDYDQVYRAVAHFISSYGRIDFIDSQNDAWIELEAQLREDFNLKNGFRTKGLDIIELKSKQKTFFRRAKANCAPHQIVQTLRGGTTFSKRFSYPVIVKANNILDNAGIFICNDDDEFTAFFQERPDEINMIIEPLMGGHIETYDGISDSQGNVIFAAGQVMMQDTMSAVKGTGETVCYTQNVQNTELTAIGQRLVNAFELKNCFFHFKCIRMEENRPLFDAKQGDIFVMEISTSAPGGFVIDKMNYAYDVDVYKIWAECLAYDENKSFKNYSFKRYVAHFGRVADVDYMYDANAIKNRFGDKVLMAVANTESIPGVMCSDVFLLKADTLDELQEQVDFIMQRANGEKWN